ncbi:MAG: hypothetical protein ACXV4A_05290 [Actinomycetes bacterium]
MSTVAGIPRQRSVDDARPTAETGKDAPTGSGGWRILDGDGQELMTRLPSRGSAVRLLGPCALRGAALPLVVLDAAGQPTGDRLGG